MALPVWMDNLLAYCLQMAILAAAGTLLAYIFRLRIPRISLYYWQVLLIACLALPLLQKWEKPAAVPADATIQMTGTTVPNTSTSTETVSALKSKPRISTTDTIVLVFAAGALLRLLWLALGFYRLRVLLRRSEPIDRMPPVAEKVCLLIGVRARFYLSDETDSPATFGIFNPAVILPRSFPEMSKASREAVLCHELLHVRRRDWALIFIEEMIRTVFWFHPAVWWLLSRIHLTREQSVDHEVVSLTGNRQPYLDSLLEIARKRGRPKAVPAQLFLRERHLVERVALLIKEVSMNRLRLALSLAAVIALLAGTVHFAAAWLPLTGTPLAAQEDTTDTESESQQARPAPPPTPMKDPPRSLLSSKEPPPPPTPNKKPPRSIAGGVVGEIPGGVVGTIPGGVAGGVVGVSDGPGLGEGIGSGEGAGVGPGEGAGMGSYSSKQTPTRINSNVLQSKLIRKVDPEYPELAKRARVKGTVTLAVTVNEDGYVSNIEVVGGHPMLRDAAVKAVKQWKYEPTILNGKAIPVFATVTVNFVLPEDTETDAPVGDLRDPSAIVISLDESGQVSIDKVPVSIENLGKELQKIFREIPNKTMFLRVPANVNFSKVKKIVDIAKEAGADEIGLVTAKNR